MERLILREDFDDTTAPTVTGRTLTIRIATYGRVYRIGQAGRTVLRERIQPGAFKAPLARPTAAGGVLRFRHAGERPGEPDELSIYTGDHYRVETLELMRYSIRLDGFFSLSAGYPGGQMTTKPLTFTGGHLTVNFATSAAGMVYSECSSKPFLTKTIITPIIETTTSQTISQTNPKPARKAKTDI